MKEPREVLDAHHNHGCQTPDLPEGLAMIDGTDVAHHAAKHMGPRDGKEKAGRVGEDVAPAGGQQEQACDDARQGACNQHDLAALDLIVDGMDDLVGHPAHEGHGDEADEADDRIGIRGLLEGEPDVGCRIAYDLRPDEEFRHHTGDRSEDCGPYGPRGKSLFGGRVLFHASRAAGGGSLPEGVETVMLGGLFGHQDGDDKGDEDDDAQDGHLGPPGGIQGPDGFVHRWIEKGRGLLQFAAMAMASSFPVRAEASGMRNWGAMFSLPWVALKAGLTTWAMINWDMGAPAKAMPHIVP